VVILNEGMDFDGADHEVRRAFLRQPEKVLLTPPARLYRWTNRPLVGPQGISPWWSFVESRMLPSGAVVEGFRISEDRARRLGRTHREFARSRAAISDDFRNTMTELLLVQLTTDVWGFAGQASGQPEFARERTDLQNVFLIGGAQQLWIPNLTALNVQVIPALA
jgi:hypothetical protein